MPFEHAVDELQVAVRKNQFRGDLVDAFVALGRSGAVDAIAARIRVESKSEI